MSDTAQLRNDTAKPPGRWSWKRLKGRFLIVSIIFHVLLALVATYLVVQTFAPRKQTFKPGPKAAANKSVEHKINMVKQQKTMTAPAQAKRITTKGLSKVVLPEMPDVPNPNPTVTATMGGLGGTGAAISGAMAGGTGTGGGGGLPFFGLRDGGAGLEGTFYDFKRISHDQAVDKIPPYNTVVERYTNGEWGPKSLKNYRSPVKLYSKVFFFPGIRDTAAGNAFQAPETKPGGWIAHYQGTVIPPESGTYRFVGFGDNVMIVKLDNALVLDASDHGYTGKRREAGGVLNLGAKRGAAIFFGNWFTLRKGDARRVQIAIGDEGGIFCAGLFIQKQGAPYKQGNNGIPTLPLFAIGTFNDAQKATLKQFLPDEAFTGPAFVLQQGRPGLLSP